MAKKVLIIDDDPAILSALVALMDSEGYETESAVSANSALAKIIEFMPDIIILDYMLSGSTGCEVCAKFRSMTEYKDIPVIMISAYERPITCFRTSGADDFLTKPFDIQELLDKVSYFIH
jgi:DNA-binding response OmpR family regulator